jgi:hypothetical protein
MSRQQLTCQTLAPALVSFQQFMGWCLWKAGCHSAADEMAQVATMHGSSLCSTTTCTKPAPAQQHNMA